MSNLQARTQAGNTFNKFHLSQSRFSQLHLSKSDFRDTLWKEVENFLQPWLKERQILIQKWHKALTKTQSDKYSEFEVQSLCQILMDYISAGHFEIYEKLLEESKAFNDGFLSLAEPLYELIGHSTEQALKFNDQYASVNSCRLRKRKLPYDLSVLGERLAERFEAEDQLVKFLHQLHRSS